jgi:uncharacterized membrane-anchored protein
MEVNLPGFRFLLLSSLLTLSLSPHAEAADNDAAHRDRFQAAWDTAARTATEGPATIRLRGEATLEIPPGEAFVPAREAAGVLRAYGNEPDRALLGLVVGIRPEDRWMVVIRFVADGHVRDDDTAEWRPDALLASLRAEIEANNRAQAPDGDPPLDVTGWIEPPAYDPATHRLSWSARFQDRGDPTPEDPYRLNYNTYVLGRGGYFSLNLATYSNRLAADRLALRRLLTALVYETGHRYEDFVPGSDPTARYGVTDLIRSGS